MLEHLLEGVGRRTGVTGKMTRNTAKNGGGRRRRPASERETQSDRFEFARRHIVQRHKLVEALDAAREELRDWLYYSSPDVEGRVFVPNPKPRKARTPEEREHLKQLNAAIVNAEARLLLHDNDGRDL